MGLATSMATDRNLRQRRAKETEEPQQVGSKNRASLYFNPTNTYKPAPFPSRCEPMPKPDDLNPYVQPITLPEPQPPAASSRWSADLALLGVALMWLQLHRATARPITEAQRMMPLQPLCNVLR